MNRRSLDLPGLSLALALALAACGGPTAGGSAPGASAASKPGSGGPRGAEKTGGDAPKPSGTAEAKAGQDAAPKPASKPAESPFHLKASTDAPLPLRASGDALYVFDSHFVGEVTPDGVKPVVAKEKDEEKYEAFGLPWYGRAFDLGGSRGDTPVLVFLTDNGRVGFNVIYQRSGGAWKRISITGDGTGIAGLGPWRDGRTLGLVVGFGFLMTVWQPKLIVVTGAPTGTPQFAKGDGRCASRVVPSALLSFPSGEVLTVGSACVVQKEGGYDNPVASDKLLVERWGAGQLSSKIDELPVPEGSFTSSSDRDAPQPALAGASPTDIYLNLASSAKEPALLHFDGATWTRVDPPSKSEIIRSIAATKDGALYAIAGKALFKKPADKGWEEVPAPAGGGAPVQVLAQTSGAVWVAAATDSGGALWTTGAPPARVERVAAGKAKSDDYALPKPATPKCKTNFAMLYAFTKVTPPDYDFPLTRQAVKGKRQFKDARFVVVEENGRKYFGAILPNYSMGKALVEVIEKEVKGAKPALLCHEPKVVREMKLNIETGEPVK